MCVFMTGFSPTSPRDPSRTRDVTGLGNGSILNFSHRLVTGPVMTLRERLPRRSMSRRLRFLGLTSHEQVELRKLRRYIIFFAYLKSDAIEKGDNSNARLMEECQTYCESRLFSIKFIDAIYFQLPGLPNLRRTIDSFDESSCDQQFRFLKPHLYLLLRLLRFPRIVLLNNGIRMPGEEVLLRGLYEIRSGDNQFDAAVNVFGRDQSVQSRAYTWFVKHIYEHFSILVTDNLEWWFRNGFMEESRQKIWTKMTEVSACYLVCLSNFLLSIHNLGIP